VYRNEFQNHQSPTPTWCDKSRIGARSAHVWEKRSKLGTWVGYGTNIYK
jgi:hypothetical protein